MPDPLVHARDARDRRALIIAEVRRMGSAARHRLTGICAWAVPNDEAIEVIAALARPVVEIGAGTGYWAWLLQQDGVTVHAFDEKPGDNHWCDGEPWTNVQVGDHTALATVEPGSALMLCWPPYDSSMARDCITAYTGDTLIYIGEDDGGCCADDAFFRTLETGWTIERCVEIPQWYGLHDALWIYRRAA